MEYIEKLGVAAKEAEIQIAQLSTKIKNEILLKAAQIAAYYSKGFTGDKISIDYTQKRYINKPKGAKPGFVTYINEKNILVIKPEKI